MARYFTLYSIFLVFSLSNAFGQPKGIEMSFEQALGLINRENKSVKIANQELDWARSERQRLNALWYPQVTATGAYVHLANKVQVKEPLSLFTDPVKDFIQSIDPGEEIISSFLDKIDNQSFSVLLFPQNATSIDVLLTYPVFTAGKRIYASKIGKYSQSTNLVSGSLFGLRLGQKIVGVKKETYDVLERHLQDALKLET